MTVTPVRTWSAGVHRSSATGFFFRRPAPPGSAGAATLYLVTSRHVFDDGAAGHRPDAIDIEVHVDAANLRATRIVPFLLHAAGSVYWRAAAGDGTGPAPDLAVLPLPAGLLPAGALLRAFGAEHLGPGPGEGDGRHLEIGDALSIVGFPLGFFDTVNRLPVLRQAALASSGRTGFQGRPCFLTDARTHRGMSGAPVVARGGGPRDGRLRERLLGIHSARMDMHSREPAHDETLGLNTAWSAALLGALTR